MKLALPSFLKNIDAKIILGVRDPARTMLFQTSLDKSVRVVEKL